MPINQLNQLVRGHKDFVLHVFVSRLWQHRGATDVGPIKHTDMVFQDTEGDHMYGEIAPNLVQDFINKISEGKVYELKNFLVSPAKNYYMTVQSELMIRFNRYTSVREVNDDIMKYPLCTYALTPLDDLSNPTDNPETFTDVVGIITGVSPLAQFHSATRSAPSTKRMIYLSDASGFEITLVLWGERAATFDGEGVLKSAESNPVIAIFVGTLVKPYEGNKCLSGGAPCRWYIDEELPEIIELRDRLQDRVPVVRGISLPGQSPAEISAEVNLETKTVNELRTLNIYNHKKTKFFCTAVLTGLVPDERWWFHACRACNRGTIPYGTSYRCPVKGCEGTGGTPRYRICYSVSDGTGDIQFMFFDKAGKDLIGKGALSVIRSRAPAALTIDEAIEYARADQTIPKEFLSAMSKKYRMVVSVTTKSFEPENDVPTYQVHRIEMLHGKQHGKQHGKHAKSTPLGRKPGLALASPGSSGGGTALSPAGEALADSLLLDKDKLLEPAGILSGAPLASDVATSSVGSEAVLPLTPSSVNKPIEPSVVKGDAPSAIRTALFQDETAAEGANKTLELAPHVEPEIDLPKVGAHDSPSVLAGEAAKDKNSTKRKQQKVQPATTAKKPKP